MFVDRKFTIQFFSLMLIAYGLGIPFGYYFVTGHSLAFFGSFNFWFLESISLIVISICFVRELRGFKNENQG